MTVAQRYIFYTIYIKERVSSQKENKKKEIYIQTRRVWIVMYAHNKKRYEL